MHSFVSCQLSVFHFCNLQQKNKKHSHGATGKTEAAHKCKSDASQVSEQSTLSVSQSEVVRFPLCLTVFAVRYLTEALLCGQAGVCCSASSLTVQHLEGHRRTADSNTSQTGNHGSPHRPWHIHVQFHSSKQSEWWLGFKPRIIFTSVLCIVDWHWKQRFSFHNDSNIANQFHIVCIHVGLTKLNSMQND